MLQHKYNMNQISLFAHVSNCTCKVIQLNYPIIVQDYIFILLYFHFKYKLSNISLSKTSITKSCPHLITPIKFKQVPYLTTPILNQQLPFKHTRVFNQALTNPVPSPGDSLSHSGQHEELRDLRSVGEYMDHCLANGGTHVDL